MIIPPLGGSDIGHLRFGNEPIVGIQLSEPARILRAFACNRAKGGILAVALAVLLVNAALAASGETPENPTVVQEYTTGSGDKIRINVFGHADLSGQFLIDGSGTISLPLIGDVRVGGMNVRQIEKAVYARLVPDYLKNPKVNVEVLNYRPFYILGEVKRPGSYPYVNGMTVITAVALGGGYTYRARENDIFITRAKDPSRKKLPAGKNTVVMPGDVVQVPERFF